METEFWQAIVDAGYAVPEGYTVESLTPELLAGLGSTDPQIRDNLVYDIFSEWIWREGFFTADTLREVGHHTARSLSVGLGETNTDSIFLRSFSALILGKVIEADNLRRFLSREEVHHWLGASLAYVTAERDLRGYVPVKGWAHAAAHMADLMMYFALNHHVGEVELKRILEAVACRVTLPSDLTLRYLEDERLAFATVVALQRNILDESFTSGWIEGMAQTWPDRGWVSICKEPDRNNAYQNARSYLRSLYFQLLHGIRAPRWYTDGTPFERTCLIREVVLSQLLSALRHLDPGFFRKES